jgi:hypothetical protein
MIVGSIATLALTGTLAVAGGTAADAAECIPSRGTDPAVGSWSTSAFTDWLPDPTTPADPDHQDGEDNVLDTARIGPAETRTGDATVEDSGWVTEPPAGAGWVLAETKTVSNGDGWTETIPGTPGSWSNFEPNDIHAPFDGPPAYPSDPRGTWSAPKTEGGPQQDTSGVYQYGQGHGSWFFRSPGTPDRTVEHAPSTHLEYRYERTSPGTTEYRWAIEKRTNTEGADPVTCEEQPPGGGEEQPPGVEPAPPTPVTPAEPTGTSPSNHATPAVHHASVIDHRANHLRTVAAVAVVPTSIDAGL